MGGGGGGGDVRKLTFNLNAKQAIKLYFCENGRISSVYTYF